ncbi:hypothetical protein Aph01nite_39870 [Acrocarpospora phusangensis]|uniref:Tetratricopeptide repeat protein n=1 Tax=Acrocarpospora phusangensis TaxID=1070424 RepID=A0A919QG92_9ACTN|nr:hypothetical protein [Acrocarpospora phusangensis]GIH25677.1 hypothetical protein Aph01nite_39870 [Acrocarpospora phusangensis]
MRRAASVLVTIAALVAVALIVYGDPDEDTGPPPIRAFAFDLPGRIEADRRYLTRAPGDATVWAELGLGYLEQARVTANPAYYPKAENALRESLRLRPAGNDTALVGMAALTGARHEFDGSRDWAIKAAAANPANPLAHGLLSDAYLQLGDPRKAHKALQAMLDTKPGVASFVRAAHLFRLKNQYGRASDALKMALDSAAGMTDIADIHCRRGDLAWHTGRPSLRSYELALAAHPGYPAALAGRARALVSLGRDREAVRAYATAVARNPEPQTLMEYGELLKSLGREAEAETQFRVFRAALKLFAAGGVIDDLTAGRFEADHGDPMTAVVYLAGEWSRRPTSEVSDAYAWALHRAGRDRDAIRFARADSALAAYHRSEIERALGRRAAAKRSLARALELNPNLPVLRRMEVARGR